MSSGSKFLFSAVFLFGKMSVTSAIKYNSYGRNIQYTTIHVQFIPVKYSIEGLSNLNILINFSA
jgi:hypothetical protein